MRGRQTSTHIYVVNATTKSVRVCIASAPTHTHHQNTQTHTVSVYPVKTNPESLAECRQRGEAVSSKATLAWETEQTRNTLQKERSQKGEKQREVDKQEERKIMIMRKKDKKEEEIAGLP